MIPEDIDAGLRLCRQSHWNQVARDWQQFLDRTPGGAGVAVDADGGVVGSVATMRYEAVGTGETLAWIAMVLVDPAHRGGGIGTALLQHGLEQTADVAAVGLDATPLGQPLYEKLGFTSDVRLARMQRPASGLGHRHHLTPEPADAGVRPARAADLDAIASLDASAAGLDRRAMLAWLLEGAPELAWVSENDAGMDGVLLGRTGHNATHLGPLVAHTDRVAHRLLQVCLAPHATTPFFIDVADEQPGWRAAVEALGFEVQRPFTRMYRGLWRPAADPSRLFAIIGPEFG
jgi:GNAT superfamily N-acetyltransferase